MVFGNANGGGEENRNFARIGAVQVGVPVRVPGTTLNRLCGSSLDAATMASQQINPGDADANPAVTPLSERHHNLTDTSGAGQSLKAQDHRTASLTRLVRR